MRTHYLVETEYPRNTVTDHPRDEAQARFFVRALKGGNACPDWREIRLVRMLSPTSELEVMERHFPDGSVAVLLKPGAEPPSRARRDFGRMIFLGVLVGLLGLAISLFGHVG